MANRVSSQRRYDLLYRDLSRTIPQARLIRTPLRTFAYGVDASFYRLVPKLVVQVQSEAEVINTVRACADHGTPYTYRAAGTSLSGQALSDSVLIQISRLWDGIDISSDGLLVRCQPAALGGRVNRALAGFQRKIGPDPASIDSAMIGGMAANNASGMCCGNIQDTYHTMDSIRVVFSDGSVLDTASPLSRNKFAKERCNLVEKIEKLARRVKSNAALVKHIRHKYRIKNTTGYSIHALIDFDDPLEIIAHLMVGSEGTLGFISEITYRTVPDPPYHGTALILFPDIRAACKATSFLARTQVAAVEIMDRYSLGSVKDKPGIPESLRTLGDDTTALLIEVAGSDERERQKLVDEVNSVLAQQPVVPLSDFTFEKFESKRLWEIRKGLFPLLGQTREPATTIIIEDVAFPPETLAEAACDLRRLFQQHGYDDAVIFGHALQGNLHFVFCVDFNRQAEIEKYAKFMDAMTRMVTEKYDGSLKAEHGTGRNVSPFVEREWGEEGSAIMREIKSLFDPQTVLNPGVIISDNPRNHIANLKRTPVSNPIIEKCTECGFCERTCPSRNLSLTPRQRIAAWREISRLMTTGEDRKALRELRKEFDYAGDRTCATDGLCATLCPLEIDTGAFIKEVRAKRHSSYEQLLASAAGKHLATAISISRALLHTANAAHSLLGTHAMTRFTRILRRLFMNSVPEWNQWLPRPSSKSSPPDNSAGEDKVVYFPSCVSRLFGTFPGSPYADSQNVRIEKLLVTAGYSFIYPARLENLCCGMAFASKGFPQQAEKKMEQVTEALIAVSANGKYPVLVDTSPCAQRLKASRALHPGLRVYDISDFLMDFVVPRVRFRKRSGSIAVHVPCSVQKSGQESLIALAKLCAENVRTPDSTPCCGFAGDRGFTNPELTASALVTLKPDLAPDCELGFSTSRTCEIGLSLHSGISYQSIAYLVDESILEGTPHSG